MPRRVGLHDVRRTMTLVASLVAMVSLGSCEKVPLLAPTASTIFVVSSRSVLPINGTAEITATVIEQSGSPTHNGTLVTFTTTLGTLSPREAVTRNGQAVVTLHAGTESGVASIAAYSGSAQSGAGADGAAGSALQVTIGGAATASISLTASPSTVPALGGTVSVIASVVDESGNLLAGVPVSFSVSAGSLGATSVLTAANGQATTTVTTDRDTTVTASSGAQTTTATITVSTQPTVVVTPSTTQPTVDEPTTITVSVTAGTSAIRDVSINFGDNTSQALGALSGSTNVTHTYGTAGTFTVTVTATDSTGAVVSVSTAIVVEAAGALNVTMAVAGELQKDRSVTFTATVTVASGTLEIDRFEWNFGDGNTAETSGSSTSHVYRAADFYVVTVEVFEKDGRTGIGRVEINVLPQSPLNVNLSVSDSPATVAEVVAFTATATGTSVPIASYTWNFGDNTPSVTTSGNTVTHVYSTPDTYTVTVSVVTTEEGTGSTQITLVVVPLQIEVTLTISPLTANSGQPVTFTATVTPASVVITRYDWDFGNIDGDTTSTTGRTTTFAYKDNDKGKTLTVTVTAVSSSASTQTQGLVTINP